MKERYYNIISAIDGKKYREPETYGFPFLSRHKPSCRKEIEKDVYETRAREEKKDGVTLQICINCGYTLPTSYHFPEWEIIK